MLWDLPDGALRRDCGLPAPAPLGSLGRRFLPAQALPFPCARPGVPGKSARPPERPPASVRRRGAAMEPISTRRARGGAQHFWQALLAGDGCTLLCCLSDPESGVGPNSVFDTSDGREWEQYRSSARQLSARPAAVLPLRGLGRPEAPHGPQPPDPRLLSPQGCGL